MITMICTIGLVLLGAAILAPKQDTGYRGHGRSDLQFAQLRFSLAAGTALLPGTIAAPVLVDWSDSTNGLDDTLGSVQQFVTGNALVIDRSADNTSRMTVQTGYKGMYHIVGELTTTGVNTEVNELHLYKNGVAIPLAPVLDRTVVLTGGLGAVKLRVEATLHLVDADYIELYFGQTNAAARTTYKALFTAERVGS